MSTIEDLRKRIDNLRTDLPIRVNTYANGYTAPDLPDHRRIQLLEDVDKFLEQLERETKYETVPTVEPIPVTVEDIVNYIVEFGTRKSGGYVKGPQIDGVVEIHIEMVYDVAADLWELSGRREPFADLKQRVLDQTANTLDRQHFKDYRDMARGLLDKGYRKVDVE